MLQDALFAGSVAAVCGVFEGPEGVEAERVVGGAGMFDEFGEAVAGEEGGFEGGEVEGDVAEDGAGGHFDFK